MTVGVMPSLSFHRPCWAEINLAAFQKNWAATRAALPASTSILAVVKANAYGHGLVSLSRAAVDQGAVLLGVSSLEEGIALREAGIRAPILILGSLFPFENVPVLFEYQLTPTVASVAVAQALSAMAAARGQTLNVHVEVDTGMGRTGVSTVNALEALRAIAVMSGLSLEGVYTHFSSADIDPTFTRTQAEAFHGVVQAAAAEGIRPRWVHMANSAGVFSFSDLNLWTNLARLGLTLYGIPATPDMPHAKTLEPVLAWKTRAIFVKNLPAGSSVSYARTWTASQPSRVATIAVGYADGFPRVLSNRGYVLIRGQKAPVIGRVTMDMTMIDITAIPDVAVGDEVVLIGAQGTAQVSAWDMANWANTNAYEIVCGISARVPRVELHGER